MIFKLNSSLLGAAQLAALVVSAAQQGAAREGFASRELWRYTLSHASA
ncbi:hypothetical protein [Hydrocarboniphaga sp.]